MYFLGSNIKEGGIKKKSIGVYNGCLIDRWYQFYRFLENKMSWDKKWDMMIFN